MAMIRSEILKDGIVTLVKVLFLFGFSIGLEV